MSGRDLPDLVRAGRTIAIIGVVGVVAGWAIANQHSLVPSCTSASSALASTYGFLAVAFVILAIVGIAVSASGARQARRALGVVPTTSVVSIVACSLLIPVTLYVGFVGVISFGLCFTF